MRQAQSREQWKKLTPTKDDSGRATFGEQVTSLEEGLSKHGSL